MIPFVGEWKRVTPEWREKKKTRSPHSPAALQRNIATSQAIPGITGGESENEGVRGERETKVQWRGGKETGRSFSKAFLRWRDSLNHTHVLYKQNTKMILWNHHVTGNLLTSSSPTLKKKKKSQASFHLNFSLCYRHEAWTCFKNPSQSFLECNNIVIFGFL